jgi:predicted RNA-binding Zn-ribbon protein involved in translation (DUF1610 family)
MNIKKLKQKIIKFGGRVNGSGNYHDEYVHLLEEILERSDNSDYAVPPSATPKVCPHCKSSNHWRQETCECGGLKYVCKCGQTFA